MTTIYPDWFVRLATWFFLFAGGYFASCWAFPPVGGYPPGRLTTQTLFTGTLAVQAAGFGAAVWGGRLPRPPRPWAWWALSAGLAAVSFCLWAGGMWFLLVPGVAP